jgi:hypothetical protein
MVLAAFMIRFASPGCLTTWYNFNAMYLGRRRNSLRALSQKATNSS